MVITNDFVMKSDQKSDNINCVGLNGTLWTGGA